MREILGLRGVKCLAPGPVFTPRSLSAWGPPSNASSPMNQLTQYPCVGNIKTFLKWSEIWCLLALFPRPLELWQNVHCLPTQCLPGGIWKDASPMPASLSGYFYNIITGSTASPAISQLTESSSLLSSPLKFRSWIKHSIVLFPARNYFITLIKYKRPGKCLPWKI